LVGPNGEQVGIVRVEDALRLAAEADLDLVEVAPTARPPVCKLMDFGKFKYESAMKERAARRNQTNTIIKEIKLRPKIDPHDYGTKKGHVERFLKAGDKVKVTIMFRGREQSRPELGFRLLQKLAEDIGELGFVESTPKQDGRNMIMVIGPTKKKAEAKAEERRRREHVPADAPAPAVARAPVAAPPTPPAPAAEPVPEPVAEQPAPPTEPAEVTPPAPAEVTEVVTPSAAPSDKPLAKPSVPAAKKAAPVKKAAPAAKKAPAKAAEPEDQTAAQAAPKPAAKPVAKPSAKTAEKTASKPTKAATKTAAKKATPVEPAAAES